MPRMPTLQCSVCGRPMWEGKGALPNGEGRCLDCRRSDPTRYCKTCLHCGEVFRTNERRRKYCSRACVAGSQRTNSRGKRTGARPSPRSSGYRYMAAIQALKAQGDAYCWRGCGTWLRADAPRFHPQHMTLGHIVAYDDNPALFWEPSNHAPECGPCNYADGARRTNAIRAAKKTGQPTPSRISRSSGRW